MGFDVAESSPAGPAWFVSTGEVTIMFPRVFAWLRGFGWGTAHAGLNRTRTNGWAEVHPSGGATCGPVWIEQGIPRVDVYYANLFFKLGF